MEMHQIRYFLAVYENKNFTRAAKVSFVSQPSLTQAIHRLEDELGGPLFSRGRQGAEPTTLGRLVEANLRSIYETSLQAKEKAVRFQRLKKEPVRIGVMHSIGTLRINPFFARYQKESPRAELEVIVEPECVLMEKMRNGELDCVVSTAPKTLDKGLSFEPLYEEKYVVALGQGHALARKKQLTLKELENEPYLDRLNCEMREALKGKLEAEGLSLYAAYRSNREEWLLEMVRENVGFAIVPEYSLPRSPDFVRVALSAPALSRRVGVLRHSRPIRRGAGKDLVQNLIQFLKTSAPER